ncbi:MAG: DUF559 domain-containing protein [Myxococcales bacterium]|nr:DUF559 domain-containing protein [Myxococcales bacterium]
MAHVRRLDARLLANARDLRSRSTDAERRLWRHLRGRRLLGHRFRRQHPLGPYILDFFCAAARLCVEVDGDQHGDPTQREHDERRSAYLRDAGIDELRFANHEVLHETDAVLEVVARRLGGSRPV